uniref:Amino acid transporter n=1 Tax=Amazona collaria TaxID=241587 RepID=A0A8B9GJB7_9PSIT
TAPHSSWARAFWQRNGLLTLSMLSVATGCLLGFLLRALELTELVSYFSFPGELLMRMLKMLILPLITSRNMFPSNLVEASFQQYRTVLVPVVKSPGIPKIPGKTLSFIYFAPDDENPEIHRPVFLELTPSPEMTYRTLPGTSNEMNVLGIVIFSATIGLLLGRMGERGAPLVNVCQCLNEAVMKIVSMAVWYFPFGIVFLIAGKILEMEDPSVIGQKLGLYAITVVSGLAIHGVIILPLLFVLITKKNPFAFIQGMLQALLIALATSSSGRCPCPWQGLELEELSLPFGNRISFHRGITYFAIQTHFAFHPSPTLSAWPPSFCSITATAASIGAAGIPQSGLVTMVIVLTSVGLPTDDITLIIAVDWALDRFRTMTNVLGDALAAGIIAHICEKDFTPKAPATKALLGTSGKNLLYSLKTTGLCSSNRRATPAPEATSCFALVEISFLIIPFLFDFIPGFSAIN